MCTPTTGERWWTDGGLVTTAAGLARIGNALYAGRLLPRSFERQMLPPHPGGWGFGTFDWHTLGVKWIGYDGEYGGYETENWTDPKRGLTVVVFTNLDGDRVVAPRIWRVVAGAALRR
jgi:CubicO group peptidase (beta-lactamase class C family)